MTGYDYEHAVAAYLLRNGFHDVEVTKASGDYGVDIIAQKGSEKYAIQCKYYSKPIGVSAVQEVAAGKMMYGCTAAMVVTNNRFTNAAENLANVAGVILVPHVSESSLKSKDSEHQQLSTTNFNLSGTESVTASDREYTCTDSQNLSGNIFFRYLKARYAFHIDKTSKLFFSSGQPRKFYIVDRRRIGFYYKQTQKHKKDLDISPITALPCKFTLCTTIDGKLRNSRSYNLDDLDDIKRFPLETSAFYVNNQSYHFNDYFRLCAQFYEDAGYKEHAIALREKAADWERDPVFGSELKRAGHFLIKAPQ